MSSRACDSIVFRIAKVLNDECFVLLLDAMKTLSVRTPRIVIVTLFRIERGFPLDSNVEGYKVNVDMGKVFRVLL